MVFSSMTMLLLVAGLLLAPTALGQAAKCPAKPPAPATLQRCDVLILGGGPGGLFSAYLLRSLGKAVCVVDKGVIGQAEGNSQAVGAGRMLDFPGPDPNPNDNEPPKVFGTCGLRINEAQKDLRCLAHELNVTLEESNFETVYHSRGRWVRAMQDFVGSAFNLSSADPKDDLEVALLEYALVGLRKTNPLTGETPAAHPSTRCAQYASVAQYLVDAVGSEGFEFLNAGNSFRGDWYTPLDVCGYIEFFKADWDRCCTNFYPEGGWSAIHMRLRAAAQASGVRFFPRSDVACLYRGPNGKYTAALANRKGWVADRLIVNAGPLDLARMGGDLAVALASAPSTQHIQPIPVAVYNAYFPNRWWEKYQATTNRALRIVTDARCSVRSEFPGHAYVLDFNATRPVYVDDPKCVAAWRSIYEAGGLPAVRKQAMADMRAMFPDADIPEPTNDLFYVRDNSWHYVGPFASAAGVTVGSIAAWALAPVANASRLCMAGEPYAIRGSGWAHGAWQSAVACLKAQYSDLVPGLEEKLAHYESGCSGMESFPNEVFGKEQPMHAEGTVAMPAKQVGLMSAGGAKSAGAASASASASAFPMDTKEVRFRP